ncbi:hypothetical protein N2152v2_003704 [Parachlorella kessleri]
MSLSTSNGPLARAALSGVVCNDALLQSSSTGNPHRSQFCGDARPGRSGKPPPSPAVPLESSGSAAPAPGPVFPRAPSVGAPATPSVPNLPAAASASPAQLVAEAEAGPRGGSHGAAASPAADVAGEGAARTAVAADMCRRIQAFLQTISRSGLLMSALLALELKGSHPATDGGAGCNNSGLGWTLAQMLALHLKAGYPQASEAELLALLWVLEAWGDVWRSPCTVVLQSYLQNLPAFDGQRALAMSRDWAQQFRALRKAVSDSQMDVLKRLDWRVRLDFAREVRPCWQLLFRLPSAPTTPHAGPRGPAASACPAGSAWTPVAASAPAATQPANSAAGLAGAAGTPASTSPAGGCPTTVAAVREGWVQQVEVLSSKVSRAAQAARAAAAAAAAGRAARARQAAAGGEEEEVEGEEEMEPETPTSPTKRQRFW